MGDDIKRRAREIGAQPAYPFVVGFEESPYEGMSLREHYIGCALQGLCANPSWVNNSPREIADEAECKADAVLQNLTEEESEGGDE